MRHLPDWIIALLIAVILSTSYIAIAIAALPTEPSEPLPLPRLALTGEQIDRCSIRLQCMAKVGTLLADLDDFITDTKRTLRGFDG